MKSIVLRGVVLPLFALAVAGAGHGQGMQTGGNPATGRNLYTEKQCGLCHGSVGQGGASAPILAATELPLDAFVEQLRHPLNEMAPYDAHLLSDSEAADIYAYVRSLPGRPAPENLPKLLQPEDPRSRAEQGKAPGKR
jgi:mono/diheme cytochrome c family protein